VVNDHGYTVSLEFEFYLKNLILRDYIFVYSYKVTHLRRRIVLYLRKRYGTRYVKVMNQLIISVIQNGEMLPGIKKCFFINYLQ